MIAFAVAVFALLITPGPGVLSVAGIGAGFGFSAGQRFLWGLCLGNSLVGIAVVSGLAAILFSQPVLRTVFLVCSLTYLTYLAYRVATAGSEIAFIKSEHIPGFLDALALQAINPKAYAVNTAFFTGFAFFPGNLVQETLLKLLIINLIWIPIHFGWLYAGASIKRLNLSDRTQRVINVLMAVSMLVTVVLAALS